MKIRGTKKYRKNFSYRVKLLFFLILLAVIWCGFCGIKCYVVMSGSMEPGIPTGSLCFINTKAEFSEIEDGNIIAFESGSNNLILHRVVRVSKEKGYVVTKGDANEIEDGWKIKRDDLVGKMIVSVPYIGYIIRFAAKFRWQIIAVIIGLVYWRS